MFESKNSNRFLTLAIAFTFFAAALFINKDLQKPNIQFSKQDSAYNINQDVLRFISIGNKRLISNIIWIQTLLESDQEKYEKNDLTSWMYLRFSTIAALDPKFYENYLYGGMYLSVVKDDLEGAASLLEKGLIYYPNDYQLNYYAGFNYFFEMGDYKKGFEKLQKIENNPQTPLAVKFVISKLRFQNTKDHEVAIRFLKSTYDLTKDPGIRKKIESDIYAIKAEHDLECLNSKREHCEHLDAYGVPYIRKVDGTWQAQQDFKIYKIYRPRNKN